MQQAVTVFIADLNDVYLEKLKTTKQKKTLNEWLRLWYFPWQNALFF